MEFNIALQNAVELLRSAYESDVKVNLEESEKRLRKERQDFGRSELKQARAAWKKERERHHSLLETQTALQRDLGTAQITIQRYQNAFIQILEEVGVWTEETAVLGKLDENRKRQGNEGLSDSGARHIIALSSSLEKSSGVHGSPETNHKRAIETLSSKSATQCVTSEMQGRVEHRIGEEDEEGDDNEVDKVGEEDDKGMLEDSLGLTLPSLSTSSGLSKSIERLNSAARSESSGWIESKNDLRTISPMPSKPRRSLSDSSPTIEGKGKEKRSQSSDSLDSPQKDQQLWTNRKRKRSNSIFDFFAKDGSVAKSEEKARNADSNLGRETKDRHTVRKKPRTLAYPERMDENEAATPSSKRILPSSIVRKPSPAFVHKGDVVRKKEERKQLPAHECETCEKFNDAMAAGGALVDRAKCLDKASRHRALHKPPSTPPEFWRLSFPSDEDASPVKKTPL